HEPRPQESQLERQHRPGDGADRKENGGAPCPALREVQINRVPCYLPAPLRHDHHDGHGDADDGEHDMKCERDAHLRARGEEIGHRYFSFASRSRIAPLFENSALIACSSCFAESGAPTAVRASARSSPTRNRRKRLSGVAGNHLSAARAPLPSCLSTMSDSTVKRRTAVSSG